MYTFYLGPPQDPLYSVYKDQLAVYTIYSIACSLCGCVEPNMLPLCHLLYIQVGQNLPGCPRSLQISFKANHLSFLFCCCSCGSFKVALLGNISTVHNAIPFFNSAAPQHKIIHHNHQFTPAEPTRHHSKTSSLHLKPPPTVTSKPHQASHKTTRDF